MTNPAKVRLMLCVVIACYVLCVCEGIKHMRKIAVRKKTQTRYESVFRRGVQRLLSVLPEPCTFPGLDAGQFRQTRQVRTSLIFKMSSNQNYPYLIIPKIFGLSRIIQKVDEPIGFPIISKQTSLLRTNPEVVVLVFGEAIDLPCLPIPGGGAFDRIPEKTVTGRVVAVQGRLGTNP